MRQMPSGWHWRAWTTKELALVRDRYSEIGAKGIARILRRSEGAIQTRAFMLGVRFNRRRPRVAA